MIGTVRNKAETSKKVSEDADLKDRSNIHLLEAELTNYEALKVRNLLRRIGRRIMGED